MVTLSKQQVIAKVKYVSDMNETELNEYATKVSLSDVNGDFD